MPVPNYATSNSPLNPLQLLARPDQETEQPHSGHGQAVLNPWLVWESSKTLIDSSTPVGRQLRDVKLARPQPRPAELHYVHGMLERVHGTVCTLWAQVSPLKTDESELQIHGSVTISVTETPISANLGPLLTLAPWHNKHSQCSSPYHKSYRLRLSSESDGFSLYYSLLLC